MKIALITATLLSISSLAIAGATQSTGDSHLKLIDHDSLEVSVTTAREMLSEIMTVVGLHANFELKEAEVDNIQASISRRKRYILYNPEYIRWVNNITKDKWAAMALLAHEVGHHLNGHTIKRSGSKPALELEADEFAGFVLYKLGASLQQSQEVMKYIATREASRTHPARNSRMLAIENGWSKAANANETTVTVKR